MDDEASRDELGGVGSTLASVASSSPWPKRHWKAVQFLPAGHGMCLREKLMVLVARSSSQ